MGLGLGIVFVLTMFVIVGFMVFQARFAARQWRRVIAAGDMRALGDLMDQTFEAWRNGRPPRGVAPADWRALHTAALLAADGEQARVSLLAEPDVRVVDGRRLEVGTALEVARRSAVRMAERLLYEVPHVSFRAVQIDVHTEYRAPDGSVTNPCLLSTRVTREIASWSDWTAIDAATVLAEWDTREAATGSAIDPSIGALLASPELDPTAIVRAAPRATREQG